MVVGAPFDAPNGGPTKGAGSVYVFDASTTGDPTQVISMVARVRVGAGVRVRVSVYVFDARTTDDPTQVISMVARVRVGVGGRVRVSVYVFDSSAHYG